MGGRDRQQRYGHGKRRLTGKATEAARDILYAGTQGSSLFMRKLVGS